MVQLKVLTGSQAGTTRKLDCFPASIGRAASAAIQLQDAGVWDQHLALELDAEEGFFAKVSPDALASLNGQAFRREKLRNGDLLEMGAVKLQFWIDGAPQSNLAWRERFLWVFVLAIVAAEAILLWQLAP